MGQHVAMAELKIFLVLLARQFDLKMADRAPVATPVFSHMNMGAKLGQYAHQTLGFSSGPVTPVRMTMKRASAEVKLVYSRAMGSG